MAGLKKISAAFYEQGSGKRPVREWLHSLPEADRRLIGYDIATVEFAWPSGHAALPVTRTRPLGNPIEH